LQLGPTYLTSFHDPELDLCISENRRRREADFPEAWGGENSWISRYEAGCFALAPIIARITGAGAARVLEIGCGQGQKALSYAPFVGSVLGIDIEGELVSYAKDAVARLKAPNVVFDQIEANDVSRILESDKFDIIVLYAVMEHLTPTERQNLLSAIWSHLGEDAHLVIGETPNRISSYDMHSTRLSFVDSLNDDCYLQYVERFTSREDWRPYVGRFQDRVLGSYRAGRGVSYHEFDLLLGKMGEIGNHIVEDSFSSLARNIYPLRSSEWGILSETRWQGNQIDQFFSRYWLEGVISRKADVTRRIEREFSLLDPKIASQFTKGFDECGLRAYGLRGRTQSIEFDLPVGAHTYQMLFDIRSIGRVEISNQLGNVLEVIDIADLRSVVLPGVNYAAVDRAVTPGTTAIAIRPDDQDSVLITEDLGVFGLRSLGKLDPRTPEILITGNF
jgi:SAM-dependent methyltransferase